MLEIADHKQKNKRNQNLQYTENFANFTTILASLETREYEMFKQNLAIRIFHNIRFADSLNYNGPVVVITDNTKLKEYLSYSTTLGYVIGSTLSILETKMLNYEEIIAIIDEIKVKKAIAKQIPLPKILPIVIGLISNNNKEKAANILMF
ncbi:hypothetical protein C1645_814263 [Glomus cerebriforme]|uniref:Uncharacterized protein n=1 Tax=Glomus cerebriforme TaxID=658196 RepID=A0A397THI0_9GLOM|nr:hypothetical protein C1645_814263 [Glomus cerebriforme]